MATEKIDERELTRLLQDEAMLLPDLGIVVSGLSGRFPKSDSVSEFEENLLKGIDMINDQDNSRFTCGLWNLPPRAGRLKDLSRFDCEFFGFNADEANYIDFQMRILYEVVYESILDAGVNPASLRGSNTGVFFGLHCNEFENAMADDPNFKTNGYYAQYAVKVAQYFDLRGMTVTFDAACASGFVGLHNAVEAINNGIIDQAIVCSSNIPIHPTGSFIFLQMQMLSPSGYSRFLDSRADGYVKSEACVSVLLQRKHLALRNYGSMMATMTSVDGYKSEGITFPSDKSQEQLIRAAKNLAGISTNNIEYIEAHGTGTPAGDPQEARAISSVYYQMDEEEQAGTVEDRRKIGPLLVGSVKTSMGHSEAASGLCSLTKVVMMLENELIYKGLHYAQPNSNIESLMDGRLKFVEETTDLRAKIVPLSCYGFGGSNVHAIVRANHRPTIESSMEETSQIDGGQTPRLIIMFGRTKETLNSFFDKILNFDQSRSTRYCLSDDFLALVDALNSGPIDRRMEYRGFLVVDRRAVDSINRELARSIRKCQLAPVRSSGNQSQQIVADLGRQAHVQECAQRECNFFFPGLGCQWAGMAAGLAKYYQFWHTIERLTKIMEPFEEEVNIVQALTDSTGDSLRSMASKFVSIVAYQIALTNIVRDQLKLKHLTHIVGHSLGEISCAYAAGLFDEREAIMVAYRMGKTLDEHKHLIMGKMVALNIGESEALKLIIGFRTICISCINGPNSVTISGSNEEMDRFCSSLIENNPKITMHQIDSDIALHNELIMGPEIESLLKESISLILFPLAEYELKSTSWISSYSAEATNANATYFAASLCHKVDIIAALASTADDSIILELGPSGLFESQLIQIEKNHPKRGSKFHYVKMMKPQTPLKQQSLTLTMSIGELYQAGGMMNLTHFYYSDQLELPVRRQTPSLSSIFQWDHQHSLFVPRYPIQFSKSSAKCEMPVDIVQERDKFIMGHCIEGRVLYPATGYLFLIWRVFSFTKRKIFDACFHDVEHELVPVEFHNVRLLRAVILGNRVAQIYLHYEEGTGRFEIKEGGSVVVEGYARSPNDKPDGLLYEDVKERIRGENLELTLNNDDIYKQFRVSGYDYGETFRCIESASTDGRYCRVRYNGHFAAFTDSILQSIFLAVSEYAPSGGLFLPTRFDYVRFQPEIILHKIRQAKVPFDMVDGSLNTKEKRAVMTKMMQRKLGKQFEGDQESEIDLDESKGDSKEEADAPLPECVFETFCDPITGIIISDGIEMRGIKASPAPRRSENSSEILLESYQFVADHEDPVQDEHLTKFDESIKPYTQICDFMSVELLAQMTGKSTEKILNELPNACSRFNKSDIEVYKTKHLGSIYKPRASKDESHDREDHHYDIKKNGHKMLLSILDQLCGCGGTDPKDVRELVQKNRQLLMRDLIQTPLTGERFMRPLMETVIENCCSKKTRLRLLEVNVDDGLVKEPMQHLIQSVAPTVALDYALAHPEPSRITCHKALAGGQTRTYQMKDLQTLFNDHHMSDLDLIVYKDISCYSLPKQVVEQNGLKPVLSSLNGAVRVGGFVMIIMRQHLSLAERILLALCEPELVGLSKRDLDQLGTTGESKRATNLTAASKIEHINLILASRCKLMLSEAERNKMICLAKKSDSNGCTVLLFKVTNNTNSEHNTNGPTNESHANNKQHIGRVLLRITHGDQQSIDSWLMKLKEIFKQPGPEERPDGNETKAQENDKSMCEKLVWLCAVDTKQSPTSGLVGMVQALSKELGWSRLRCYYDCSTFKDRNEPISVEEIERCPKFQQSVERDLCWNIVDSKGRFGSFRHLTINDYMSYDQCLCNNGPVGDEMDLTSCGAYVNNATRGDLSSFTWYEAPYRYLNKTDRNNLIRVAYSALNFRDVMLASGRLPLDAIPLRLAMSDCLLGLEFSGYDPTGKRVIGMVGGRGIATHALCPEEGAIKLEIPDRLSLKEAATIPVVYTTAIMALIYRGRMKRGESVLIHAGSGGVGQAAIRLASHFGLEIFATVGTQEKRQFLLDEFPDTMRDDHIFSSRDCEFETQIMAATNGRGVDLVLNSLADDKFAASVRCLAHGGRFLEIGKYDMSTDTKLELLQLDDNKTFHGILLDKLFDVLDIGPAFKQQLNCILETLRQGLEEGYVKPIKSTVFKRNQIEEAFRFMATGKHIGKVLIEIDGLAANSNNNNSKSNFKGTKITSSPTSRLNCIPRCQFSPSKSYIVTGGLGGFGLELTKWLVNHGVRHVLLTSRTGIRTGYQRSTVSRLMNSYGARIEIISSDQADACTPEGAERLCRLALDLSPERQVGAIFHLAMVLKDSLLENMSGEDFDRVCRPKVEAGLNLDRATRGLALDYFVCFSSVTSGKGNAGQSNYAYANSYLERICERRRQVGEHGLAVQWGAIGDVGVAFENLGGNNVIVGGTIPQRIPSCLATLARILASPFSVCLSVVPANRGPSGNGEKGDLVGAIMHVLGIKDASKVSEQATLGELGLDSLMAVEIRQYIEREYEMTLNIQEIRSLTIAKIRDINENGKSVAAAAPTTNQPPHAKEGEPKSVESYGKCANANTTAQPSLQSEINPNSSGAMNGLSLGSCDLVNLTNGGLMNGSEDPTLDKNVVASFVPELALPKTDFIRLNYKHLIGGGNEKLSLNGKGCNNMKDTTSSPINQKPPIFFIPPIHGQFDHLELVCSNIDRPCIGLQWTRKLGRAQMVSEAVEVYLDLLRRSDWRREFYLPVAGHGNSNEAPDGEVNSVRVIDLVGYSFGATIAFELMLAIHKSEQRAKRRLANGLTDLETCGLRAGRLVLLDGSPKQIELGSKFMEILSRRNRSLELAEKVDELLMFYIVAHTRGLRMDYAELQLNLRGTKVEDKIRVASERLARILNLDSMREEAGQSSRQPETDSDLENDEDKTEELAHAMEAFCRRYELITNYKATSSLPSDCALIRADKVYLKKGDSYSDDLDLSSVVRGKVSLHVMSGDHESFLYENSDRIGEIISNFCSL